jgi:phage shock protein A
VVYLVHKQNLIPRGIGMGVLERIESIIKANLNDLLGKTENPEKILQQLILDMESELAEARDQVVAAIREEKRLRMLRIENEKLAEKWQKKAMLAVQYGKDDLAREAILRKRSAAALAEDCEQESHLHAEVIASLKASLSALEAKIQEAKQRKDELIVRKRRAKLDQLLRQDIIADKKAVFDRIENKIMSLSAEAEALADTSNDEIASRQREEELEAELAKLKEKLRSEDS